MKRLLPVLIVVVVLAGILAVPASAASSPQTVTYTVQQGDTLAKIGRQFCTSWQEIYYLNQAVIGPNPNVLKPGTVLQVPNHCGGPVPPCTVHDHGPTQHASGTIYGNIYTVAYGDTTYSVSKRFGMTVNQLAAANRLANPNYIYGGQTLVIPGLGPCPPPPPPPPHRPFITITSPVPGALLPATFTVSGTGGGLFEGNVVVRAVNSAGQVLAEKATILQGVNGGMGGAGTYSVQLTVNVSQNTAGKIVAFSTSPKDGSTVASASVPVTFTPGASQPFITIGSPVPGALLPPTFTVSGTGGGLFEGNVVVRAVNNAGQVLAEKATTLQGANVGAGGTGTYSVQLTVNVAANTPGKIVAYSPSPSGSGNVAQASVPVTFGPGGSQPFITISSPAPGALLPATFTVSGTGGGLFEGNVVVRAVNSAGQVLAEKATILQGVNGGMGGAGTYSVQLTVNVSQNTAGKIVAFSTSPKDGSIVASAGVPVTFTPGTSQPFITIGSPAPGSLLPATFTVSGTGGGLFEGNVVVRAVNNAGHVLAEKATTLQGTNVGTGGAGTYSVQLTVNVAGNTPGKIIAYSPSPSGSGNLAQASVPVTFGPGGSQPFITISSPAPGALLPATFTVSGTGGGLFEGGLVVRAQNNAGQILAQQPATLQGANVGAGGAGTYSVQVTVNVSQNVAGKIVAYAGSQSGSGVLAQASVPVTFSPSSPAYKNYAPGQCKIQGKPGAPFYAYPGGPQAGYFGSGGTFDAVRGAKVSGAYWYEINTDPGSGNPAVWVPTSSTTSATAGCAF